MIRTKLRKAMIWILAVAGVYIGVCFALAGMYRHPGRQEEHKPDRFQEITVGRSPVWVIGPENAKASFVMCHGYGGSRNTWTDLAEKLADQGYRCYIPSMPAHGANPDTEVGFGITESQLALEVARLARKDDKPVIGVGVSLGGAAILLACEKDPGAFDAICTESAFTTLTEATNSFLDRALPAGRITFAPVRWIAEAQSGVHAAKIQPIRGAKAMQGKPCLIMHGTGDRLFPIRFGEELSTAAGVELWRVAEARHAYCFDVDPAEYTRRLVALAESIRPERDSKPMRDVK